MLYHPHQSSWQGYQAAKPFYHRWQPPYSYFPEEDHSTNTEKRNDYHKYICDNQEVNATK